MSVWGRLKHTVNFPVDSYEELSFAFAGVENRTSVVEVVYRN